MQEAHSKRRRNRPSKACIPCRRRKVKCDLNQPCAICLKRKHTHLCIFEHATQQIEGIAPAGTSSSSHRRSPSGSNAIANQEPGSMAGSPNNANYVVPIISEDSMTVDNSPMLSSNPYGNVMALLDRVAATLAPYQSASDATTEVVYVGQNASAAFFWSFCSLGDSTGVGAHHEICTNGSICVGSAFSLTNRTILHPFGSLWASSQSAVLSQILQALPAASLCIR